MPNPPRATDDRPSDDPGNRRGDVAAERGELLGHLTAALEPVMTALGMVFLVLLVVDYADVGLVGGRRTWLDRAMQAIWAAFLVDFGLRFAVAPDKGRFLRLNWLGALSLALPFLRPFRTFRALRAGRALRGLSLVRLLGGINRGMRVLRRVTRGRQAAYLGALTVFVTLAGAVGVLSFDRGVEGAPIQTFGDALWWSTALVTTINSERYVVSPEARVIAILLRLYAVSVFGLVTGAIASYFVGRDADERRAGGAEDPEVLRRELAAARHEVALLRGDLRAVREAPPAAGGSGAEGGA